ncbi:hypothetical protein F8M49_22260 [Rhodococcus zopfii]|uniref:Uncharacterized protein n=1 Tax=Rhodococcus zopfii TaxID=43772 RepID=A0ABU3WUL9_9NOCA|nr:hypothetical protein [Rhodococcus zopfii]
MLDAIRGLHGATVGANPGDIVPVERPKPRVELVRRERASAVLGSVTRLLLRGERRSVMATYTAGSAAVDVWPSFTDFQKKVQAFLATVDERACGRSCSAAVGELRRRTVQGTRPGQRRLRCRHRARGDHRFRAAAERRTAEGQRRLRGRDRPRVQCRFRCRVRAMGIARTDAGIPVAIVPDFGSDFQARIRAIAIARG